MMPTRMIASAAKGSPVAAATDPHELRQLRRRLLQLIVENHQRREARRRNTAAALTASLPRVPAGAAREAG